MHCSCRALHCLEDQIACVARNLVGIRAAIGNLERILQVWPKRANKDSARSRRNRRRILHWRWKRERQQKKRGRLNWKNQAARLRGGGNGHGLSHEFFKGGQARLDGILESVTAGERVGGFQAVTGDAKHRFFIGPYAALLDQRSSRNRRSRPRRFRRKFPPWWREAPCW